MLLKAVVKAEQAQGWRRKLWPAVCVHGVPHEPHVRFANSVVPILV